MKRRPLAPVLAFLLFFPLGGLPYGAEKPPSGFSLQDLQVFISGASGELHRILARGEERDGPLPDKGKVLRVKHLIEFYLSAAPKTAEWWHETWHGQSALQLVDQALERIEANDPQGARTFLKQAHLHVGALQGVLGVRILSR